MIVTGTANYKFGGVVMPIYKGTVSVSIHVDWHGEFGSIDEEDAREKVRGALRRKVQKDYCYQGEIILSNLKLEW